MGFENQTNLEKSNDLQIVKKDKNIPEMDGVNSFSSNIN